MNKISIIILLLAITKHATANSSNSTTIAVLVDASQSESSEDNETIMDRELKKSKSKTKFNRMTPTSNVQIDSSACSISVEVIDPKGIEKVWIETKYENENYVSHRATRSGNRYELNLIELQEGTYTWRVKAQNKKNKEEESSAISFSVICKCFYYRGRKWKAYSTFISDLTLYYFLLYCSRNPKQRRGPTNFESN
jgi:hypothetical protein